MIHDLLAPGDWAVDVGANVGHYTKAFSDRVGPSGRVLAFEPIPETFALLTANTERFRYRNVTLLNAAVSDTAAVVGMTVPGATKGRPNYYQAHLVDAGHGLDVLTLSVDALRLPSRVALVKIDAEGHEIAVLRGMAELIRAHRPTLVIEKRAGVATLLGETYEAFSEKGSPNEIFRPRPVTVK